MPAGLVLMVKQQPDHKVSYGEKAPAGNENNVPAGFFFTVQTLKTTVRRKSVETIVSRSYDEPGMTAAFERRAGDGGQWVERSV